MSHHTEPTTPASSFPTMRELRQRSQRPIEVLTRFQHVQELDDGYAFCYPCNAVWSAKLEAFTKAWQKGFPWCTTELIFVPNQGPIWLHIRGSEEVKQFMQDLLRQDLKMPSFLERASKFGFRLLTNQIRLVPDFLIIGAAKCGTTSLYAYLTQNPCIASALKKEIYFFDQSFRRGLSWYRAHFPTILQKYYTEKKEKKALITGEATPCYIFHPHVPKRVFENLPNIKIIVLLRNPVDMAYSFYNMKFATGIENLSFEDALDKEEERLSGELEKMLVDENYYSFTRQHFSYLSRGIYVDQLKIWLSLFPKEQMLILTSDDLYKAPAATVTRVTEFLGLLGWKSEQFHRENHIPYAKMEAKTRQRLLQYFAPHNQRLYELLGTNFGWHT